MLYALRSISMLFTDAAGPDGCKLVTVPIGDPIKDRSFLAQKIQDLCKYHDIYWTKQECDSRGIYYPIHQSAFV